MPAGGYMPYSNMDNPFTSTSGKQYVTIVNLTPHRFKLLGSHSYQFDTFDFGDIPQGKSRQNVATYTTKSGKNAKDDNGEAYYSIDGTDKKFVVRCTTHIPDDYPLRTVFDLSGMGQGQREYLDVEKESAVTLVITGSDSHGFVTNLRYGPGNWMSQIYDVIKDRQVKHLVMPGSHDAGMSTISGQLSSLGSKSNTQTQGLNIYDQLRAGARWFDLRIGSVHENDNTGNYAFYVLHVNDETADVAIGNSGESLDDVISQINQFTRENPGELVFFKVRYLVGIRHIPSFGPIYWTPDITNNFFGKLKGVNNRCGNLDPGVQFQDQKASYFLDQNNRNGCVLFLLDGHLAQGNSPTESPADGIYNFGSHMSIWDNWSNKPQTEDVANDQIADWKTVGRSGSFNNDQFVIGQWIVSTNALQSTFYTLQNLALKPTNPALYWKGVNGMSPEAWPNVLLVDYLGAVVPDRLDWNSLSADIYTLAIGMNLYMISENCDISHGRSPLLPPSSASKKLFTSGTLTAQTNSITFANGTVVHNAPADLHPGRAQVLRAGTVFCNGTVLSHDVQNPDFASTMF